MQKNDLKTAGDPHKPLRQQLVPHPLHNLPPSSHILQVDIMIKLITLRTFIWDLGYWFYMDDFYTMIMISIDSDGI